MMVWTNFKPGDVDLPERPTSGQITLMDTLQRMRQATPKMPSLHYQGVPDFILQHGEWFKPRPKPNQYLEGTPKYCFSNSQQLCQRFEELTYVEGYCLYASIPVHHGWVVDKRGRAIDVTLPWSLTACASGAMIGIRIPLEVWLPHNLNSGICTVLDDWRHDWPIMRERYNPNRPGDWLRHLYGHPKAKFNGQSHFVQYCNQLLEELCGRMATATG